MRKQTTVGTRWLALWFILLATFPHAFAERFPVVGAGKCAYQGQPMAGLGGILYGGNEHEKCRNMCSYIGRGCIAFSWNHCSKECILHGLPEDLLRRNITSVVSWGSADGCPIHPTKPYRQMIQQGGPYPNGEPHPFALIEAKTGPGACDMFACYLHEKPCTLDTVYRSNTAEIFIKGIFSPNELIIFDCPEGFGGKIQFKCVGVGELLRVDGRCGLNCKAGKVDIYDVTVEAPSLSHGETFNPGCNNTRAGTHGDMVIVCDNNRFVQRGECLPNCPAEIISRKFFVDVSYHGVTESRPCPKGYSGDITVSCNAGTMTAQMGCTLDCVARNIEVDTIGGPRKVQIAVLGRKHEVTTTESCPPGYSGSVTIKCVFGVYIPLEGHCGYDCVQLGDVNFGPVKATIPRYVTHNSVVRLACHEGNEIDVLCYGGEVSGVDEAECHHKCYSKGYLNNGIWTNPIPTMIHGGTYNLTCPDGTTGFLDMECHKGHFRHHSGLCGRNCPSGGYKLVSGTMVTFDTIPHGTIQAALCETGYRGDVGIKCNNTVISAATGTCAAIVPDCNEMLHFAHDAATEQIADDLNFVVAGPFEMYYGESDTYNCPVGWGEQIKIECIKENLGEFKVSGSCGIPCGYDKETGLVEIPGTAPPRMHLEKLAAVCPDLQPFHSQCINGVVNVTQKCGQGCNVTAFESDYEYVNPLDPQELILHSLSVFADCPDDYTSIEGVPLMECDDGKWLGPISGECGAPCVNDTSGWDYKHLEVAESPCEDGYSGAVLQSCFMGNVTVDISGCMEDCEVFTYADNQIAAEMQKPIERDKYWEAPMPHGQDKKMCREFKNNEEEIMGEVERTCEDGEGVVVTMDCRRDCIDHFIESIDYAFVIYTGHIETGTIEPYPCGYPDNTHLYRGNYTVSCTEGAIEVVTYECAVHCVPSTIMINDVEVKHDFIEDLDIVEVLCNPSIGSDESVMLTCEEEVVSLVEGTCHKYCPAGQRSSRMDITEAPTEEPVWIPPHLRGPEPADDTLEPEGIFDDTQDPDASGDMDEAGESSDIDEPEEKFYHYPILEHNETYIADCVEGFTGHAVLQCIHGDVQILEDHCLAHCPLTTVFPGGEPIDLLPFDHETVNKVPCSGNCWTHVKCFDGEVTVQRVHANYCGYEMELCSCCFTEEDKNITVSSKASLYGFHLGLYALLAV